MRVRLLLVALLLPSLLGGAFLTLPPTASAAAFVFTVDDTTDAVDANTGNTTCETAASKCTLRAAIQQANALAVLDPTNTITIELTAGQTYKLTLVNPTNAPEDVAATGDLDIKASVTINGHGATVDGDKANNAVSNAQKDRVFQVFSSFTVAFNDLTITGGYIYNETCCQEFVGGGILNDDSGFINWDLVEPVAGGSLTLTNCVVDNNGHAVLGGGIFNGYHRTLTINNSTVSNNQAQGGGGLFNLGTATIAGGAFTSNSAGQYGEVIGGGGIASLGTLSLTGSRVISNSATIGGGISVAAFDGTLVPLVATAVPVANATITNTEISSNIAQSLGGGVANLASLLEESCQGVVASFACGSTAKLPTATDGSGAGGALALSDATMTIMGGIIVNNSAGGSGLFISAVGSGRSASIAPIGVLGTGGGGVANSGTLALTGVTIANNNALVSGTSASTTSAGGGVFNVGALTIEGSALTGNAAVGVGLGGGIANGMVLQFTRIIGGATPSGGARASAIDTSLAVTNTTISGNSAPSGGGAIYNVDESAATLNHVTIANNQSGILNSQETSPPPSPDVTAAQVAATVSVQNSILAANTAYNCSGAITNGGNNVDSAATCGFGAANNSVSSTDPLLGPLAVNAPGTTATYPLLAGSPALDRVPSSGAGCAATDQRGVTRPSGAACDSGAYELIVVAPSPSPSPGTFTVTLSLTGNGTTNPAVGAHSYTAGTTQPFTATPSTGNVFLGWTVDGVYVGFGVPLDLPVTKNRTVVAAFAPIPAFCDISPSTPNYEAIIQLAARGIIKGSDNPSGTGKCFLPDDILLRIHVAGFVARAFGWDQEDHGNDFIDKGSVDNDLWRNAGTLAFYDVARGYRDGTYDPLGPVLHAQAVSFVTRAMIRKGYWILQEDNATYYTGVPLTSGHRQDAVSFYHYAGNIPGTSAPTDAWDGPTGYSGPATRSYFAQVLWLAYSSYFSVNHIP